MVDLPPDPPGIEVTKNGLTDAGKRSICQLSSKNYAYWFTKLSLVAALNECDSFPEEDRTPPIDTAASKKHTLKSKYALALIYQSLSDEIRLQLTPTDLTLS